MTVLRLELIQQVADITIFFNQFIYITVMHIGHLTLVYTCSYHLSCFLDPSVSAVMFAPAVFMSKELFIILLLKY